MSSRFSSCASALALALCLLPACTQVRGRKRIQEANELYRRGRYAEAVTLYKEAESLVPELPVLWLNEGYTCRQLIAPGGQDPESRRAGACALAAFQRLAEVAPQRPARRRADSADLVRRAGLRRAGGRVPRAPTGRRPNDLDAVHGLQDVYFKWGKWPQALEWSKAAAALRPADAEAQYGVGTFVWQILSGHGGGTQMAGYTPLAGGRQVGVGHLDDRWRRPPPRQATSPPRRASRWPTRGSSIWKKRSRCARATRRR